MKWNLRFYIKVGMIFLILILVTWVVFLAFQDETETVRQERLTAMCHFGMNRIAVALMEYAEKDGEGLFFPSSLDVLTERKYLPDTRILYCGAHSKPVPYYYFAGLRKDMPGNLPILIEWQLAHVAYLPKGNIRYGRMLSLNGTVSFIREDEIASLMEEIKFADGLLKDDNMQNLRNVVLSSQRPAFIHSLAAWKLGQKK